MVRDPDDPDHRLLATVKSNLAVEAPTWGYSLVDVAHLGVARVDWDTEADRRSASELLTEPSPRLSAKPSSGSALGGAPIPAT